jgi:transcriptional regulator with XRE-family HTH domain
MSGEAEEELARVRELRQRGLTPKEIARKIGLPPARVTQLVRKIAAAETVDPTQRPVVECWVSPGWSAGLTVTGHPEWLAEPAEDEASSGLVGVLLAREAGRNRVSVCGWLVDVYCLGIKNDLGPEVAYRSELPRMVRDFFAVFGERPVAAPLDLAQHLVLGAAEYARGLGFEPAAQADFADTRGHLGSWEGPSAIRFGRHGKPFYISGPHDDASRVVRQLERSVGAGNFEYMVGMPA